MNVLITGVLGVNVKVDGRLTWLMKSPFPPGRPEDKERRGIEGDVERELGRSGVIERAEGSPEGRTIPGLIFEASS
jgi:hypothetical protein